MVTQFVHPVRRWKDWFSVTEGENGKFIGMGEIDDEGRVAPRRLVVEYPA
ncbi:tRNA pseudouridine(55) synthase TruB [Escherichia coli]